MARYLTIDDVLKEETIHSRSAPAVSPDGRWVAITVQSSHEERLDPDTWFTRDGISGENLGSTLRLVRIADGQVTQPFGEGVSVIAPAWSPDGSLLAAYVRDGGHACLATWSPAAQTKTLHREFPVRPTIAWERPQWSPDGSAILAHCARTDLNVADELAEKKDAVYVNDPAKVLPHRASKATTGCMAVLDIKTGRVRLWREGWGLNIRFSPDGRRLALAEHREALKERLGATFAVRVGDASDGATSAVLAEGFASNWPPTPTWSPDSRRVAIRSDAEWSFIEAQEGAPLHRVPPAPDEAEVRTSDDPVWRGDGGALCAAGANGVWAFEIEAGKWRPVNSDIGPCEWLSNAGQRQPFYPDPEGAVLVRTETQVVRLNLATGAVEDVCAAVPPKGPRHLSADGSLAVGGSVWGFDVKNGRQFTLFAPRPGRPEGIIEPRRMQVTWTLNGKECKGTVWLPQDWQEGKRLPTILQVYPGRQDYPARIQPPDLLVAEGFAVFLPEVPLPGKEGPLAETVAGVEAAADAAVAAGWADPDALGVMGHSYGGYGALCVAVGSRRFKAVAALSGMSHLSFAYPWVTGYFESGQGRMGGPYWDHREKYLANSPFERLPEVSCPLLLAAGTGAALDNDEAWLTYLACARLGKTVVFLEFAGAQHAPPGWPAHARRDLAAALRDFFKARLAPQAAAPEG